MKTLVIFIILKSIINFKNENKTKNKKIILNGVYRISSLSNNFYLKLKKNELLLLNEFSYFRLILIELKSYYIELVYNNKKLGIDDFNKIKLYNEKEITIINKVIWDITKINDNQYLIQNKFTRKCLQVNNYKIICHNDCSKKNTNFIFSFLKLYEEVYITKKHLQLINKEPIDVLIKYIDLTDKTLNRSGIKQNYKDIDNEELKYSIRSIFKYISWIRKIYILMPNKEVKFFKSLDLINDKIIYINDKDLLGFDSANIFAFTFNLYKLENFGISKNFIYLEDDFFIGKPLKKKDFFYYDEKEKKIVPFILTKYFNEMNKTQIYDEYENLIKFKDSIFPHSSDGWWLSIYSTDKYFIEKYKLQLINTLFTHNVIAENLDDLKEIFHEIKDYKYINETLFSKERHILSLNQPHFLNLYQLNIKKKKVHPIQYKYIKMENLNKIKLDTPLFVINTGGNHKPLKRNYKIQKKFMEKRYPFQNKFEIRYNKLININTIRYKYILKLFLIFNFIKLLHIIY